MPWITKRQGCTATVQLPSQRYAPGPLHLSVCRAAAGTSAADVESGTNTAEAGSVMKPADAQFAVYLHNAMELHVRSLYEAVATGPLGMYALSWPLMKIMLMKIMRALSDCSARREYF
ncbi:hypothetical protein JKP88DRAFT_248408 [Tribonema minus]|uniref:Uncharacterized protein n=1 Tax=Tribonema minus TaxID=303371 RepID=A0A835YWK6_9STRA|nr:hypothetical protein JKP88DRAFT_248408 [Tribonema minus]